MVMEICHTSPTILYYLGAEVTHSRRAVCQAFFTPKGWHNAAQGNALGRWPKTRTPALKGRKKGLCGESLRPFRAIGLGAVPVPRALPWAALCHPFGVKKKDVGILPPG
jgi:hypothetical protein